MANQVLDDLRIQRRVSKIEWQPSGWVDTPYVARRGELRLWPGLRGKLLPDDWRPVLAAALTYQFRYQAKRWAVRLTFLAIWFTLVGAFLWYYIPFTLSIRTPCYSRCGGEFLLVPLTLAVLTTLAMAPIMRRVKLQADRRAVQELGIRTELARVLGKIDEILLRPRPQHPWLSLTPTIPKRLENLASAES